MNVSDMGPGVRAGSGRVLYAGIDEAGYGPRLGPLCIGVCAFEAPEHLGTSSSLWTELAPVVGRSLADARAGCLAIADSKKLKRSNASGLGHAIAELERSVHAVLRMLHPEARLSDDTGVLGAIAGDLELPDWYRAEPIPCPAGTTEEHVSLGARRFQAACVRKGVAPRILSTVVVDETRFNSGVDAEGSKAAISMSVIAAMLPRLARMASADSGPAQTVKLVLDRQGGRTRYADEIRSRVPGSSVRVLEEAAERSMYRIDLPESVSPIELTVAVGADRSDFCVSLASMGAKLVRELLMERFNRHWHTRCAELKPTAGYGTDAGRWIREASDRFGRREITPLVRKA